MEFPAASSSRGLVPWLGLLMAGPVSVPILRASNTTVTENEDAVVMTCYTDEIFINWLFNATTLQLKERMKLSKDNTTLTIDPVRREDAGNYQCKVSNPINSTERPASVPTLIASNTTVTENEDAVVMTCYTDEISIKWLFNATSLRLRRRMKLSQDDKTLTIDPVRREDAGNYQCKVSNPVSYSERPVSVPKLLASNTTVTENEDAMVMTCYTDESSTNWLFNAKSLWLKERMKLSEDHRTLTIDPVRREDAGNYQCKVSNPVSSAERPVSVPTLLASNTTVTENEDAVVMTCYTDESSTNWLFNAKSLWLKERMKLSEDHRTLTIDPVRREDAGNYQCKVSNPVSSTESVPVELDVKY
ncbi:cell adhesion molecule CEACAM1-like [Myotis yumanensis]|uniref:cell adhesion molecule CEACAM1-like n=1 Tax=Myotis yumanensis TaxID=159337 RepID=UPI0038D429F8